MAPLGNPSSIPLLTRQKLTTKIVGVLITFLLMALMAIGFTLELSWQLEGGAGAINDTGSLRMKTYRLTFLLNRYLDGEHETPDYIDKQSQEIESTFTRLWAGDPVRPLILPKKPEITLAFQRCQQLWKVDMQPEILKISAKKDRQAWTQYLTKVDGFVGQLDHLVKLIEEDNSGKTFLLRSSQLFLIAMALTGTVAVIYLFFLMIIRPVDRLHRGMQRMAAKDFSVRLPVETQDEFGQLAEGFNRMADRLADLYGTLEKRVQKKTEELAEQNKDLSLLYDTSAFLGQPQTIDSLCQGFLDRLIAFFGADGGTVRLMSLEEPDLMHIVVHRGISEQLAEEEFCLKKGDCHCGNTMENGQPIVIGFISNKDEFACAKEGFKLVSAFPIFSARQQMGIFNLHFRESHVFTAKQLVLLETLGRHVGAAIQNQLLKSKEKDMAVTAERQLLAQDLHDSIAQGLSFLNLQVQLLEDSLRRQNLQEVDETLEMLKVGVQESYVDVRELLTNFRTRIEEENFGKSLLAILERFRRQTGIKIHLTQEGDGAPLQSAQQLQVLFIIQEALSNVRKHAKASQVEVFVHNGLDFSVRIRDDGVGFHPADVKGKEGHVGLSIMTERAERIQADFQLFSVPDSGTEIQLTIRRQQRFAGN